MNHIPSPCFILDAMPLPGLIPDSACSLMENRYSARYPLGRDRAMLRGGIAFLDFHSF